MDYKTLTNQTESEETSCATEPHSAVLDRTPNTMKRIAEIEDKRKSSDFQSFMNSAKLNFGNAYLSIPNVFSKTGWLGGLTLFSTVGMLNIYTMLQNIYVADRHPSLHSYSEIGGKVFGKWGKIAVDIPIWIMQLSTCCSYLYFIAEQIDFVVCSYTGGADGGGYCDNKNIYIAILTIPALPVSWIETYTFLSYFSIFGVCAATVGLLMMFGYLGTKLSNDTEVVGELKVFDITAMFGNVGVAMFVFEGNAVVLNVRAETINQHKYPCILTSATLTVITMFMIFSTVAYATYKETCNSIFILNLEPVNAYVTTIVTLVCINCFISYPV
jgi:amino acid permease